MMIQNQKIIAILFSAILAIIPLGAAAQQETDENSFEADNSPVQVAFRTVEQQNLLGGVSVVNVEELVKKSSFGGGLDALIGGVDYNTYVWGMNDLLVVVDGIPRDYNNVLASEIAQVTILKGAAAIVLYGSRAAKGVAIVTTKRGAPGDLRITVRANTSMNVPKSYPKYLGSAEYMTLYNEARSNDGLSPLYTSEQIYNHGSGINPYRYPDLNFYSSDYLKKAYNYSDAMAEITGGNERAQYYTTMGYYREGSILKVGNTKNDNINRMFIRGNIDVKLHELITAYVDANATFYNSVGTNTNFWNGAATIRPNRISPLIPLSYIEPNDELSLAMTGASGHIIDGKYFLGGTQLDPTNPIADAYAAGTRTWVSRQFQFNGGVNFNLKNVLDGLFFRGKYAMDYATSYSQAYNNSYATFTPTWTNYAGADMIGSLVQNGLDSRDGKQNISNPNYRTTTFFSGQFDYTKAFDGGHNLFAMLMANGWLRKTDGRYQAIQSANLGLQLSYNYMQKYYADFSAAVPHSPKLPDNKRNAFSPTGTLGWRLTKEDFMANQSIFNDLFLSVSGGIINTDLDVRYTDNDNNVFEYFLYKEVANRGEFWGWGDSHSHADSKIIRSANPNLGFIQRKDFNVGLRGALFEKLLTFDVNYFYNRMEGGLARGTSMYPSYFEQPYYPFSSLLPFLNYNIDDRQGIDFSVYFNKKAGEVSLTLGVSGMYQTDKAVKRDENYGFDYQSRIGRPLNSIWGLENLGFFNSEEDVENSVFQSFGAAKPGDIKYKDQNGDNIIDSNDEVFLARWQNSTTLGLNLTVKWKRFTLFAMGTGYFGGHGLKNNSYYWAGRSDRKYSEIVRDRWTEETKGVATYPRLTTTNGDNNFRSSDFWLYKTDRFDLSMVQLTYDVPTTIFSSDIVKGLSVYLGGYDLLIIAKEREYMEMAIGGAPYTRFFNFGFKATF
jgi:TonB-linked SusC/RagA family outer membrane protein